MQKIKLRSAILLALLICFTPLKSEEHKIIYTISTPRSLGTAFMRTFEARPDFIVFNEPSIPPYVYSFSPSKFHELYKPSSPKSFEELKNTLFQNLETSNIMLKDLSFTIYPFLEKNPSFIQNPKVHFVFLLRKPHASMISFYFKSRSDEGKKEASIFMDCDSPPFDPVLFEKLTGFESLYEAYQLVKKHTDHPISIVFAEDLSQDSQTTYQRICKEIQIDYIPDLLHFEAYTTSYSGASWHEYKKHHDFFINWHGEAVMSTRINDLKCYEVDEHQNPTFSEIKDPIHRQQIIEVYQRALPYYEFFKDEAQKLSSKEDDPN